MKQRKGEGHFWPVGGRESACGAGAAWWRCPRLPGLHWGSPEGVSSGAVGVIPARPRVSPGQHTPTGEASRPWEWRERPGMRFEKRTLVLWEKLGQAPRVSRVSAWGRRGRGGAGRGQPQGDLGNQRLPPGRSCAASACVPVHLGWRPCSPSPSSPPGCAPACSRALLRCGDQEPAGSWPLVPGSPFP